MADTRADKKTRDSLFRESRALQKAAMSGRPIPMPQRTAMKGQAQALFEQWIELEAARFNNATEDYKAAIAGVNSALEELQKEVDKLENAIRVVERATAVIRTIDKLLALAIKNFPI